jgi:hypothetical protein
MKEKWSFNGESFRNLDNFDKDGNSSGINIVDLPNHAEKGHFPYCLVYHNGSVFYCYVALNYFPRVQLLAKTNKRVIKWTSIKNVAPIINTQTQRII